MNLLFPINLRYSFSNSSNEQILERVRSLIEQHALIPESLQSSHINLNNFNSIDRRSSLQPLDNIIDNRNNHQPNNNSEPREAVRGDDDISVAIANSFLDMYRETPVEIPEGANAVTLEALSYRGTIDPDYICPLSGQIMTNPYSHPSQVGTFERDFIFEALRHNSVNPLNRQPMQFSDLRPDIGKKLEIDRFVSDLSRWLLIQRRVNQQIPSATLRPLRLSHAPTVVQSELSTVRMIRNGL